MHQTAALRRAAEEPGSGWCPTSSRIGDMTSSVPKATTLVTEDGVPIEAVHLAGHRQLVFVIAHGFTLHWDQNAVWQVARRLNR